MNPANNFKAIGIFAAMVVLNGCSKPEPLSCNSEQIKSELLKLTTINIPNINFVSESISEIQTKETQDDQLDCQAKINYYHNIFPNKALNVSYTYQINAAGKIGELTYTDNSEEKKYQQWALTLPNIIEYQKSRHGILAVLQEPHKDQDKIRNQVQQLTFDNTAIPLAAGRNYSTITIDRKYIIESLDIYIISAYFNGNKDNTTDHSYLIAIESANQIKSYGPFSYQDSSLQLQKDSLYFEGIKRRAYAESNDFPLYRYQNSELKIIRQAKPDSYYRSKFARLSPEQILQQIKNDGCLNGDQFYSSDICSIKASAYCFEFTSINAVNKNKAYWLLMNMCQAESM